MIYITGDKHRNFKELMYFCYSNETTIDDVIIVLGDAGINYYLNDNDYLFKKSLQSLNVTLFLVHGNHEQRPSLINSYEESKFFDGSVYIEKKFPNLVFAKCGEVYNINGLKTLVIGGAYSIDKFYRLNNGLIWFESEQPDASIKNHCLDNLNKNNFEVDVVLSHTAPLKFEPTEMFLPGVDQSLVDKSTEEFLGYIENKLIYKKWYLGHYHCDKSYGKVEILFNNIIEFYKY